MNSMLSLELTEKKLDQLAADTLAEMGEAPPVLPEQPVTEEDAPDEPGPLSWLPKGSWVWRGRNPVELGSDGDGRMILTLNVVTSRAPALGEFSQVASDLDDKARADALFRLQSTPEWASFIEAKAEHTSIRNRLDSLVKEDCELESERLQLASRPKGKGARLVEIESRQTELSKEKRAAEMELQALHRILDDARKAAIAQASVLALDTIAAVRAEMQQSLDNALTDFTRKHAAELSALAERLVARNSKQHETWLGSVKTFILARLEAAQPALDA
jgi:hypothetical protein